MRKSLKILVLLTIIISCKSEKQKRSNIEISYNDCVQSIDTIKMTDGFDFPVGKPDAKKYYNAQKFGVNEHLGDDWNGVGGGNTDLGDPIYSIGKGYVTHAKNIYGGWGNVIRIVHYIDNDNQVESVYAHCNEIFVKKGEYVTKGQKIGTIGNNDGKYLAHLHFEIRNEVGMPIGGGYSSITKGYLDPTNFIRNNRTKKQSTIE